MFRSYSYITAFTVLLIIIDQASKIAAQRFLEPTYTIIPDFFTLRLEMNSGIAFSIPIPIPIIFALTISLLIIGLIAAPHYLDLSRTANRFITALILAGGLSNLIDRIRLGAVIDFISIYRYPVFNLADSAVTIAVALLIIFHSRLQKKPHGSSTGKPES